jgi:peptidoglycan/LPS O-acetylase OafA/YrhL
MSSRIEALDSLRGLAALTVLSQHVLLLLPDQGGWLWRTPFYNGREAVILFFVLSGYVLYLPWARGRAPGARAFLVKRFCRIYLPYVAILAVSALGMALLPGRGVPVAGLGDMWPGGSVAAALAAGLDLLFNYNHPEGLVPIAWTLVIEAWVSLAFPWLAPAFVRRPLATAFLALAAVALASLFPWWPPPLQHLQYVAFYGSMFLVGMGVARHQDTLVAAFRRLAPWARALVFGLGLLMIYRHTGPFLRLERLLTPYWLQASWLTWRASEYVAAAGVGVVLVGVLASPRVAALLEARPLLLLGRSSYSLYLVHMVVLAALAHTLAGVLPIAGLAALGVPLSVAAAWVAYQLVERPAMALGRRWATSAASPPPAPAPIAPCPPIGPG